VNCALYLDGRADGVAKDDKVLLHSRSRHILVDPRDQRAELALGTQMEQIFDKLGDLFPGCGVVEHDDGLRSIVPVKRCYTKHSGEMGPGRILVVRINQRVGKVAPLVIRTNVCEVNVRVDGEGHAEATAFP
jgi:hypothetical protein